jgi:hypothetical protein
LAAAGSMHHRLKQQRVKMLNGQDTTVQTDDEAAYYTASKAAYLKETRFTENTDLRDLDRLLTLELLVFRWQQWLFAGMDYEGDFLENEKQLIQDIKLYSDQINKIKESMGLNKKSRDAAAAEGNFAVWLSDLKARAKVFGVHREKQLTKALVLMQELSAVVGTFDRSDEEERRKIGFESEKDIVGWVRDVMLPEFKALDEHFRAHVQRYFIRDM